MCDECSDGCKPITTGTKLRGGLHRKNKRRMNDGNLPTNNMNRSRTPRTGSLGVWRFKI